MADGCNVQALGAYSHAEGDNTKANGAASHSEGANTLANGYASHAGGLGTIADGFISYSEGQDTIASNLSAHAEGYNTLASGETSHAEGRNSQALGSVSHAQGESTTANGAFSHCEGFATKAGNGGDADSAAHAEGYGTSATGQYGAHSEGRETTASGQTSHAEGNSTLARGIESHAEGFETAATGSRSHAEGNGARATGSVSHAEGLSTVASGGAAHAEGQATFATGALSHAEGFLTNTNGMTGAHIMGQFASAAFPFSWHLGNGLAAGPALNAAIIRNNGDLLLDGTIFSPTAAGYAEMFETIDGNAIDAGCFVAMDGKKIRKAHGNDKYILGITTATPALVAGGSELRWQGLFEKDEWGRVQYHNVTMAEVKDANGNVIIPEYIKAEPVLNPDWDSDKEYMPRSKRPEWVAVGLLGKILVRDDGTCKVNGYCLPNKDGVASRSFKGYRVLERTGPNQVLVLFR